jgi:hypothetical protein
MPSNIVDPSVTELLLVIVSLLGLCILFLAEITNATSGYDTTIGLVGQLLGSLIAIGALVILLLRRKVGIGQ